MPSAALLSLASNDAVKQIVIRYGFSKGLVQRFIAGETLEAALLATCRLQEQDLSVALDELGENGFTEYEAEAAAKSYIHTLHALDAAQIPTPYLSVKLTALGLNLGTAVAAKNLGLLLSAAQSIRGAFVCVDMEGSDYTERTLEIVRAAFAEYGNVGTVLQSYLRRTDADLEILLTAGIRVRLVKGAYAEPSATAYPDKVDVDRAYLRQMRRLLRYGKKPAVATHDETILCEAKKQIREEKLPNGAAEFQMLYGIRRDLQESLAAEGYLVRVYLPFGPAWYSYFMRRLAERPANIGFILRNLLK